MPHLGDILKAYRVENDLTQPQMAVLLDIGYRTYQDIEKTGAVKKAGVLVKIQEKTGIDAQLIALDDDRDRKLKQSAHEIYLKSRMDIKNSSGPILVPLVPVAAQAGYAKNFFDMTYIEKLDTYPILPGVDPHGAIWRYFRVQGSSMEDTLKQDQFILTSQVNKEDWRNIETSYIYVIITGEGVVIKRLYKVKGADYWAAVSDNPDEKKYPQFRVYVRDVKELWKFRRKVDWDAPSPRRVEIKV
jgi:phage repressor protein C with HTH and peptisase S24 domain